VGQLLFIFLGMSDEKNQTQERIEKTKRDVAKVYGIKKNLFGGKPNMSNMRDSSFGRCPPQRRRIGTQKGEPLK
jgi:hypothetical protein